MDLSIIIVNWNTRQLLRDCLASLPAAWGNLNAEVLVVDNASQDGSADLVRTEFPEHLLIESGGNLGFSKGNNLALPHATGQAVLLLNPDTVCPPESLARLFAFLQEKTQAGVVGPMLVDAQGQPTLTWGFFPRARDHWLGFLDPKRWWLRGTLARRIVHIPAPSEPSEQVDYVTGACFMMRRQALEEVGPLDEQFFMYFEETDWCWRARQAGYEVWYCAEARVAHLEGQAAAKVNWFSLRQFQKSYRLFVAKHYGPEQVGKFRLAQYAEYGLKALLRSMAVHDSQDNQIKAAIFREKARLQLMKDIKVEPPS
jgi:GT2 family glycosyltransferase|nr:glycosyltransferase family 2 protein [Candidatus Krumholzibacteria bacterium]